MCLRWTRRHTHLTGLVAALAVLAAGAAARTLRGGSGMLAANGRGGSGGRARGGAHRCAHPGLRLEPGDGQGRSELKAGRASPEKSAYPRPSKFPDADDATMVASGNGNCYGEFGMTGQNSNGQYISCKFVPQQVAQPEKKGVTCEWRTGDGQGGSEQKAGKAASKDECASLVQTVFPNANGATMVASGNGDCYGEFGMTHHNGNTDYVTCQFIEMIPSLLDQPATGTLVTARVAQRNSWEGALQRRVLALVQSRFPNANGATMVASGDGDCFAEFEVTHRNNNANYITCKFEPKSQEATRGSHNTNKDASAANDEAIVDAELETLGLNHDPSAKYDDEGKPVPDAAAELAHAKQVSERLELEQREQELKHRYCKKGHVGPVDACPLAKKWSDPKTWPDGKVPTGGDDVDLSIPVDAAIVLDVPSIQFRRLYVLGVLVVGDVQDEHEASVIMVHGPHAGHASNCSSTS